MLKIDKAEYLIKWAHGRFIRVCSLLVSVFEIFIFEIKRALHSCGGGFSSSGSERWWVAGGGVWRDGDGG